MNLNLVIASESESSRLGSHITGTSGVHVDLPVNLTVTRNGDALQEGAFGGSRGEQGIVIGQGSTG